MSQVAQFVSDHAFMIGSVLVGLASILGLRKLLSKPSVPRKNGVVYFFSLPAAWKCVSSSPFCVKLDTWLKLAKIPYETIFCTSPGPRGKWPFIQYNNEVYSDSSIIVDLLAKEFSVDFDSHLTTHEKSLSIAFQRLLEEHLYFILAYDRWIDPAGWKEIYPEYFSKNIPGPIAWVVANLLARPGTRKNLRGQGVGRMTREEVTNAARQDLQALADFLGDKPFFFGNKISSLDIIAYAQLDGFINVPIDIPTTRFAKSLNNLVQHNARIKQLLKQ